jgi:prophage antirepressor-like protein
MSNDALNQITPFSWGEISLTQVAYIDGVPHCTRKAIGEWLEYADGQKAIDNLIARNPHLGDHSVPLSLRGTDGKIYTIEVFHPIGFLLIVMESGQPKAHAMKRAVAEFVWSFAGPKGLTPRLRHDLTRTRIVLLREIEASRDAFVTAALVKTLQDVSLQLGMPLPSMNYLGAGRQQLTLGLTD